jgi:bifunctional non-homologous end joining protein LigD
VVTRSRTKRRARRGDPLSEYHRKRDFAKTREPRGATRRPTRTRTLQFVVHKHAASRLHFDLRLELDGTMKSWAIPKGPSRDPAVKRLAMQVEDHPIDYNAFEGTIPAGEYGAGTVMIWDRGTYTPEYDSIDSARAALHTGEFRFTLHGERLEGSWVLVQMRRSGDREWLLIKHRDTFAAPGDKLASEDVPSIVTGRSMSEIAEESGPVSRPAKRMPMRASARSERPSSARAKSSRAVGAIDSRGPPLTPMLASVGTAMPPDSEWAFEPKYDGVRVLAFVDGDAVALTSRNNHDKAAQFPEIVKALQKLSARHKRPFVLDGEIVSRRGKKYGRFQDLQRRIGEMGTRTIAAYAKATPTTLVAFDLLLDGDEPLVHQPWFRRRERLEKLLSGRLASGIAPGDVEVGDGSGDRLLRLAKRSGWEGIMAKRVDSPYTPGKRSRDWRKLKIEARQEFVIGGWTEPRKSRQHLGAILVGYWDGDSFVYAGHVGTGFTNAGLAQMYKRLAPLERSTAPFVNTPKTNEPAHWVKPEVVAEVKFNEWTADGRLRQPAFLGVRDDKDPRSVGREPLSLQVHDGQALPKRVKRRA